MVLVSTLSTLDGLVVHMEQEVVCQLNKLEHALMLFLTDLSKILNSLSIQSSNFKSLKVYQEYQMMFWQSNPLGPMVKNMKLLFRNWLDYLKTISNNMLKVQASQTLLLMDLSKCVSLIYTSMNFCSSRVKGLKHRTLDLLLTHVGNEA